MSLPDRDAILALVRNSIEDTRHALSQKILSHKRHAPRWATEMAGEEEIVTDLLPLLSLSIQLEKIIAPEVGEGNG